LGLALGVTVGRAWQIESWVRGMFFRYFMWDLHETFNKKIHKAE